MISAGIKSLFTSFFDGASLNAISDSNHTCNMYIRNDSPLNHRIVSINEGFDRTDKLLLALLDKESLLNYLVDLPIELMPELLAFCQRSGGTNPLRSTTSFQ